MAQTLPLFEEPTPISHRTVPRPFLKWAGGKTQLLSHLVPLVPEFSGTYHEPFVGGGALFFALRPRNAILCDENERLIRSYRGLRDHAEEVIRRLRGCPYDKDFYLEQREQVIDGASDLDVAAWMIYLNRTGFNGLYRVNRRNQFNVPFGRHIRPLICDEINLRACANVLQRAQVLHNTFESVESRAKKGDFVYFDPPYEPLSSTSNFTSYTSGGFGFESQRALRDLAVRLKRRGVRVMISNSSAAPIYALYEKDFELHEVPAFRRINCRRDRRGQVKELVIL
jgi:DNA adenine methylase